MFCQALYSKVGGLETQTKKMELNIKINIEELLGKSKELDFTKVIKLWQDLQKGKEIAFLNDMLKIQKVEDKKDE